jgi:beta-glucosidase/6-phospho-beta-glucosidase/beta-galactosidase
LNKVPLGLRKLLSYIKTNYGDPEIYITENGWSEKGEDVRVGEAALNDAERVGYYTEYINEALKASLLDGVNLKGIISKENRHDNIVLSWSLKAHSHELFFGAIFSF